MPWCFRIVRVENLLEENLVIQKYRHCYKDGTQKSCTNHEKICWEVEKTGKGKSNSLDCQRQSGLFGKITWLLPRGSLQRFDILDLRYGRHQINVAAVSGVRGTFDRTCNATFAKGPGSCADLCCGRGHHTQGTFQNFLSRLYEEWDKPPKALSVVSKNTTLVIEHRIFDRTPLHITTTSKRELTTKGSCLRQPMRSPRMRFSLVPVLVRI